MRCRCAALCCAALQVALAITKHGEGTVANRANNRQAMKLNDRSVFFSSK
jgi:hypothetical protein